MSAEPRQSDPVVTAIVFVLAALVVILWLVVIVLANS